MDALDSVSESQASMHATQARRDEQRTNERREDDARTDQRRSESRHAARSHESGRGEHVDRYA
jgi:hypothetical protein